MHIIQLSDLYLFESPEKLAHHRSPFKQLKQALLDIQSNFPNNIILILTGDLVNDITPKTYTLLSDLLAETNIPTYVIPGNHDDPAFIANYLKAPNIFHEKEFIYHRWHFILLDSSTPGKKLGAGRLSGDEIKRLQETLKNSKEENIGLFLHHPPISFGAKWFREIGLENAMDFFEVIRFDPRIKLIAFGHGHKHYLKLVNPCIFTCAPSSWAQVDHNVEDDYKYSNSPGGYNWYEISENGEICLGVNYF